MLLSVFLMYFALSYGGTKIGRIATCFELEDENDNDLDKSFYENQQGTQQDYMIPPTGTVPLGKRRGDGKKVLNRKQINEVRGALREIFSGLNAESLFTSDSEELDYPTIVLDSDSITEITAHSFTFGLLSRLNQYKREIEPTRTPGKDKKKLLKTLLEFPERIYEKSHRKQYYYEDMTPRFHQEDIPNISDEADLAKDELTEIVINDLNNDAAVRKGDEDLNKNQKNTITTTKTTAVEAFTETVLYDLDAYEVIKRADDQNKTKANTTSITTTTITTTTITTTTTPFDYGTTDPNRTFDFETPSTTVTNPTPKPKFDIPALLDIIANLTYDYETNLTHFVNETLQRWSIPTCPTPSITTETPSTTTVGYDYWENGTGTIMGKCFVCGLEETGIPYHGYCGDAFSTDFLALTPVDPRARGQLGNFRKYCRYMDIVGSYLNESDPKSLWGRWTGGCGVRWIDLSAIYTQRTCRNRLRAMMGQHFLSKRMMKLEMALQHMEDGCVISPVASLVPMSRGINVYARFHACVCSTSWCNTALMMTPPVSIILSALLWHIGTTRDVFQCSYDFLAS